MRYFISLIQFSYYQLIRLTPLTISAFNVVRYFAYFANSSILSLAIAVSINVLLHLSKRVLVGSSLLIDLSSSSSLDRRMRISLSCFVSDSCDSVNRILCIHRFVIIINEFVPSVPNNHRLQHTDHAYMLKRNRSVVLQILHRGGIPERTRRLQEGLGF